MKKSTACFLCFFLSYLFSEKMLQATSSSQALPSFHISSGAYSFTTEFNMHVRDVQRPVLFKIMVGSKVSKIQVPTTLVAEAPMLIANEGHYSADSYRTSVEQNCEIYPGRFSLHAECISKKTKSVFEAYPKSDKKCAIVNLTPCSKKKCPTPTHSFLRRLTAAYYSIANSSNNAMRWKKTWYKVQPHHTSTFTEEYRLHFLSYINGVPITKETFPVKVETKITEKCNKKIYAKGTVVFQYTPVNASTPQKARFQFVQTKKGYLEKFIEGSSPSRPFHNAIRKITTMNLKKHVKFRRFQTSIVKQSHTALKMQNTLPIQGD